MRRLKLAGAMAAALLAVACTNHQINFDQLPDGTVLPSWPGTSPITTGNPWVITTQYAPAGVASFSSAGGGVALLSVSVGTPPNTTITNMACPHNGSNLSNLQDPKTTITLVDSSDNVWVSIPAGTQEVNAWAFDSNGNLLDQDNAAGPARIHLSNVSGITRVELNSAFVGSTYCFDDFAWQELWY